MRNTFLAVLLGIAAFLTSCTKGTPIVITDPAVVGDVLTLVSGESHLVTAESGGELLYWTSSNEEVAYAYNGYITARATGLALITITNGQVSTQLTVYVTGKPVDSFTIGNMNLVLPAYGDEGLSVPVSVSPSTSSVTDLDVRVTDPGIVTCSFGEKSMIFKGLAPGETTVVVRGNPAGEKTVKVSVVGPEISDAPVEVREGKSASFSIGVPSAAPSSAISVSSANTSVARANFTNGNLLEVYGVSGGNTVISVTFGGRVTKIPVTVKSGPFPGDFYFSDKTFSDELVSGKTAIGIVYAVDGRTAKIFRCAGKGYLGGSNYSTGDAYYYWDTESSTLRSADSVDDGAANTAKCKSYVNNIAYSVSKLSGETVNWYVPSVYEATEMVMAMAGYKVVSSTPSNKWEISLGRTTSALSCRDKYYACKPASMKMYESRLKDASGTYIAIADGYNHTGLVIWTSTESSAGGAFYVYLRDAISTIESMTLTVASTGKANGYHVLPVAKVNF